MSEPGPDRTQGGEPDPDQALAQRVLSGDRRALARAITLVESGDPRGQEIVSATYPRTGTAAVVGFTGPPGAGKSTLIAEVIGVERARERTVGVLSIDPSSPFTHGAVLGDRIRLAEHFLDPGVFIRSMASRGALGGLSQAALQTVLLIDASGRDLVLLETVGVGQSELDVIHHADSVVLVLMPGSGDSVQALKAGVMEIPDIVVVNKADHPLADVTVRDVRSVLALGAHRPGDWNVPVLRTSASEGEGVDQLVEALDSHRAHLEARGELAQRRRQNLQAEVLAIATSRLRIELQAAIDDDPSVEPLLGRVAARELDPATAAAMLLALRSARNPAT